VCNRLETHVFILCFYDYIFSATGVVTNNDHLNKQISTPVDLWVKVTDGTIEALDQLRINFASK
jgi:hypothetical protein